MSLTSPAPISNTMLASDTILEGDWIVPRRVFHDKEGKLWATIFHIDMLEHPKKKELEKSIKCRNIIRCASRWRRRIDVPSPDLNPAVNAGCIYTALVWGKNSRTDIAELQRVWLLNNVKSILERRESAANRNQVPGIPGEWITDELWKDEEFDLCITDEAIIALARDEYEDRISEMALVDWRRQRQKALEGKKLDYRRLPQKKVILRGNKTIVSSRAQVKRILEQRKIDRESTAKPPKDWLPTSDLHPKLFGRLEPAQEFDKYDLGFALPVFRNEHPDECGKFPIWNEERRQSDWTYYYSPEKLLAWMNKVNVREVAEAHRRRETPEILARRQERRHRSIRFLQFVLSRSETTYVPRKKKVAPRFSVRRFRRFYLEPPYGLVLTPLPDGVLQRDIVRWAKEANVSIHGGSGILIVAQQLKEEGLLESFCEKTRQPKRRWRMLEPGAVEKLGAIDGSAGDLQTNGQVQHLSGAQAKTTAAPPVAEVPLRNKNLKPEWNDGLMELRFGEEVCKRYKKRPAMQAIILNAFERAGWPKQIKTRLSRSALRNTLHELQRNLADAPIFIGGDGSKTGITWGVKNP